jgi:acyl dehydratase
MEERVLVEMQDSRITDEMIEEMRNRIGSKIRTDNAIFNEEATRMAILKFADGIGDPNPLWRDLDYCAKTRFGTIVAPPSWIFSVLAGIQFGWRGLGGFHNATRVEFHRPILLNDKIRVECFFKGFEGPKPSKFAERIITNFKEARYYNQRNELVAIHEWSVMRFDRALARKKKEGGKYDKIQLPHRWTEEELRKIEEEVLSERNRGSQLRYYEDVEVGQTLEPVLKGPLGLTDEIAYLIGGGAPIPRLAAHGVALIEYRRHPAWAFRDPQTYAKEPIFAVHYNKEAAHAMGLPLAYDVGVQRHCWQIHMLTSWMGDDGWLKKSQMELRRHVFMSDIVRLKGKINKKYKDEKGECCVDIETEAINQRGENVMPGRATVIVPSREEGSFPLGRRL